MLRQPKEVEISMPVLASNVFDISLFEYFLPLLSGGKAFLLGDTHIKDLFLLVEQLKEVNAFHAVPALMALITERIKATGTADAYTGIQDLFIGGDEVPTGILKEMREVFPQARIHVLYGPTESTVFVTTKEYLTKEATITKGTIIGKPNSNIRVYILGEQLQLLPAGVAGEICIGGKGMARGYLNKEALTAEKFVANPFAEGERLYRTGDLGRWLQDGSIEFLGRKDSQVKIRGYRVELGEIEQLLQNHYAIDSVVVLAKSNQAGDKELVAYIVSKEPLSASDLKAYLGKNLPAYMIPAYYVPLEALPLTSNGKVDKKALPDLADLGIDTGVDYVAPVAGVESQLAVIWSDILGIDAGKIGARDNFFALGGHSLKTTRLASRIHREFAVKVALKDLFINTLLEEQARLIMETKRTSFTAIAPIAEGLSYSLSSSQRVLWVLSQFEEGNIAYNISGAYRWEGVLDRDALDYSFTTLIERHEILRTLFKEDEQGEIRQFIHPSEKTSFVLAYQDLRKEKKQEEKINQLLQAVSLQPFDLASGTLLRAGLYQVTDTEWVFYCVMHHIISDAWSMGILINELFLLYNGRVRGEVISLTPLRIQYKDYAAWQQEQLSGEHLLAHKTYWLKQFEGELPELLFPTDKVRPAVKTYNGGMISRKIDNKIAADFKCLVHQQGGTLFMGLLAAVNVLLYKYTNQTDFIIGTSIAGREHPDLEDQIGYYLNTLALRTSFKADNTYTELLGKIKKVTLGAYAHQIYPFEELIKSLNLKRDISRNNLFDVLVVMTNAEFEDTGNKGLENIKVSRYERFEHRVSKFDLTFSFNESKEDLHANIEYNSDLFDRLSVLKIADALEQLLYEISEQPSCPVRQLNHLCFEEKQKSLIDFNGKTTAFVSTISTEF